MRTRLHGIKIYLLAGSTGGAPGVPTNLQATVFNGDIILTWTDPDGVVSIQVFRSTSSGSGFTLLDTVAAGVEEFTDDAASEGVTYYYRLVAVSESAPTGEVSATVPDETAPGVPTGLDAVAGEEDVTVTWTDPADIDLDVVRVYRSTTSGSGFTLQASVPAGVEEYIDDDVVEETTYYYRVTAVDDSSNESSPASEVSVLFGAPAAVTVVPGSWQKSSMSWGNRDTHTITHVFESVATDPTLYVLIGFFADGTSAPGAVPSGATAITSPPSGGGTQVQGRWYWYKPTSGDISAGSKVFSFTKTDEMSQIITCEVIGADPTSPVGNLANNRSSSASRTSIGSESIATTRAGSLLIASASRDDSTGNSISLAVNSANGFSIGESFTWLGSGHPVAIATYREVDTATTYSTPSFTASGADGATQMEAFVIQPEA